MELAGVDGGHAKWRAQR